jgi:lipoate-protein ligase A
VKKSDHVIKLEELTSDSTIKEIAQDYIKGKSMSRIHRETLIQKSIIYNDFARLADESTFKEIKKVFLKSNGFKDIETVRNAVTEYINEKITLRDCVKKHKIPPGTLEMWIAVYKDELGKLRELFYNTKLLKSKNIPKTPEQKQETRIIRSRKKMFKDFPLEVTKSEFKDLLLENNYHTLSIKEYIKHATAEGIKITK